MKVELPELKRCCFCLPLRYGLIAWGYIKLVILLLISVMLSYIFIYYTWLAPIHILHNTVDIVLTSLLLLLVCLDLSFTIVFVVGGHRKSAKLLHIYYIYSIVIVCLFAVVSTWLTCAQLVAVGTYSINHLPHGYIIIMSFIQMNLLLEVFYLGIQVYVILLIKSEVNKLRNSTDDYYRFTNPIGTTEPTLEHEINIQGIKCPKEGSNEQGTNNQFEEIIDKTKKTDREDFRYNRM